MEPVVGVHLVDGESTYRVTYRKFAFKLRMAMLGARFIDTDWAQLFEPDADRRRCIAFSRVPIEAPITRDTEPTSYDIPPWAWGKISREWRSTRPAVLEAARRDGYVRDAIRLHLEHNPGGYRSNGVQFAQTDFLVRHAPAGIVDFVGNDGLRLLEAYLVAVRLREACRLLIAQYYTQQETTVTANDWCDEIARNPRTQVYTTRTPRGNIMLDWTRFAQTINEAAAADPFMQTVLRSDSGCDRVVEWLALPGIDCVALAATIRTSKREANEPEAVSRKL